MGRARFRIGLSLIEILMGIIILSFLLLPLAHLMTGSQRVGKASGYEVMAGQYGWEILSQVRRLSPFLPALAASGRTLKLLLEDEAVSADLQWVSTAPELKGIRLPGTDLALFVSPLDPHFTTRRIEVGAQLDDSGLQVLKGGTIWGVRVIIGWRLSPQDPVEHRAIFRMLIREG